MPCKFGQNEMITAGQAPASSAVETGTMGVAETLKYYKPRFVLQFNHWGRTMMLAGSQRSPSLPVAEERAC